MTDLVIQKGVNNLYTVAAITLNNIPNQGLILIYCNI
jgi:hypothetical protein